jgi:hypothetical protein
MSSLEFAYFKGLGWVSLRWSQVYVKTRGKIEFSDGEMNDRFTDMGFSQGHQSCGGSPIFQSGKSAKPWAREGALKPWPTWGSNPQRFCDSTFSGFRLSLIRVFFFASSQVGRWPSGRGAGHYNQDVDTVVGSILMVETQNGEMISISPLRCRNLEFLLFRLCVFAFTISRFNFVFQNPKAKCEEAKSKSFLHFAFQPFQVFGSRLFASFFFCIFASRKVAEWSRCWTLQSGCRHRCGFDPHVCQGFKAPSLAQGFADFPDWNIG